ncbi:MAG TPA: trimethylamine methyltransferase family protein [Candidatus Brocadiia bacterium]|nr:trimethylamine methyltransferase family protein [Candidatus Brocadiia bacterium]
MAIERLRGGQLRFLGDDDIARIHRAVIRVMEEVGVRMEYRPALEAMADGGCRVDFANNLVRVPESVLTKALSTAPSQFTLAGQLPDCDVNVDLESVYTIGGSSALYVLDLDGNRKPATLRDLVDLTRLQDALENLHIMHAIAIPQEIPQEGFDRILFANVVPNTSRNYYSQGQGAQSIRDQVEMASVILGSAGALKKRPIFTIVACMVSPLLHPGIRLEEVMECVKYGIPVYIEVDAQAGGTTPITIAGTLVEECANVLTGVVLTQILAPGHPCIFAIASGITDMMTGNYSGAAPETGIIHAATAQMARFYRLPFQGGTGIDATLPDAQAGYERALQALVNALAGTNFIHLSVGMMEQMLMASYEQCVIDNEIIGAAFRITRGLEVNDDAIALDVIREIGPASSDYLAHEHTLRHLRRTYWPPKVTNRHKWDQWMAGGGKDMRERARDAAREILNRPATQYLSEGQKTELGRIAARAQEKALNRG